MGLLNIQSINYRYRGWRDSSLFLDISRGAAADFIDLKSKISENESSYSVLPKYCNYGETLSRLLDLIQQIRYRCQPDS